MRAIQDNVSYMLEVIIVAPLAVAFLLFGGGPIEF